MGMTTYKLTLRFTKALLQFCQDTIGRQPAIISDHITRIEVKFDPSLTTAEKNSLATAMPDWVKKLFEIEVIG